MYVLRLVEEAVKFESLWSGDVDRKRIDDRSEADGGKGMMIPWIQSTQARYQSNKGRERRTPQSKWSDRWPVGSIIAPRTGLSPRAAASTVLGLLGAVLEPENSHFGTSETLPVTL